MPLKQIKKYQTGSSVSPDKQYLMNKFIKTIEDDGLDPKTGGLREKPIQYRAKGGILVRKYQNAGKMVTNNLYGKMQRALSAFKVSDPYIIAREVVRSPIRSIKNFKTVRNLEDGWYTGVPHKMINGSSLFMDENFPNWTGTIWTSNSPDYARVFADKNGKIFKVLSSKMAPTLSTPKTEDPKEFFGWREMPFSKTDSGYKINGDLFKDKRIFTDINGNQHEMLLVSNIPNEYFWLRNAKVKPDLIKKIFGVDITSTDGIVKDAFNNGFSRVRINNVMDGASITKDGHYFDEVLNETILAPHTPHFVLPADQNKWTLLSKNLNDIKIGGFKTGGILKRVNSAKSGIKIKPKNKGKFNATKKRTGKTTEELTHSKNPLTRKRAIFAQNAKKWNHK